MSKSLEALDKIRFAVSISQDLPYKECNDLCDIIQQDLERLEEIDKAQEVEFNNLKFTENENKYQTSIRVLKEAFIALGKSDIANTCWFKYLEQLEKENQKLKNAIQILKDKSVDIVCLQLCFKHYNVEYYNNELSNYLPYFMVVKCQLTQEEYNLLKEVLGNEK